MAAGVAGFQLIPGLDGAPDMYSVLGLSGDQNNVTFNGLGSGISALPPDVLATTSINPYPFDVSKGGFSGAQISIQTIPGSNFSRRSVTNANIAPPLEWADQTAAEQGQKYTNVRVGGNAAGPIVMDQSVLQYGVQRRAAVQRRADAGRTRARSALRQPASRRIRSTVCWLSRASGIPRAAVGRARDAVAGCRFRAR